MGSLDSTLWWVMAAILAASGVVPFVLATLVEWVIEGYRSEGAG